MKKTIALSAAIILTGTVMAQKKINQDSLVKEAAKTEFWEPVPKLVTPGKTNSDAPTDAIILYNGKDVSQWQKEKGGQCRLSFTSTIYSQAENEDPHPQVEVAFGLRMTNCDPSKPSE